MSVEVLAVRVHQVGNEGKVSGLAMYWEDAKPTYMKPARLKNEKMA